MAINLTPISALPTPPTKADPLNFAARADDFLGALPEFQVELNTSITELNKITSGLDQASPIAAWVVGTTYNFPTVVAGSDGYSYRCVGTTVLGVDPTTDDGTSWLNLSTIRSPIPVGAVVAFIGGYFSDSANGGFVSVIGNTVATLNSVLNPSGWYVCNGAALNSSDSTIFNGAARNLPNTTDERFLMGFTSAGSVGGANTVAGHSHSVTVVSPSVSGNTILNITQVPSHNHGISVSIHGGGGHGHSLNGGVTSGGSSLGSGGTRGDISGSANPVGDHGHGASASADYRGGGLGHNHTLTPITATTIASSLTENRPKFLSCFYIMKAV